MALKYKILPPLLTMLFLTACIEQTEAPAETRLMETTPTSDNNMDGIANKDRLGYGFESAFGLFKNKRCATGKTRFTGVETTSIKYSYDESFDDRLTKTHAKGSGKVNVLVASASAKASFSKRTSSNDYTSSAIMHVDHQRGAVELWDKIPLPGASANNGIVQRLLCGDEVVSKIVVGAGVYLAINVHFRNTLDKSKFKARVKVKTLFKSKTTTKTRKNKKYFQSAVLTVEAFQIGGDPSQLKQLIAPYKNQAGELISETEPIADQNLVACSLKSEEEMKKCLDVIPLVIQYTKGSFIRQIKAQDEDFSKLEVLGYETKSYRKAGLRELAPELKMTVEEKQLVKSIIDFNKKVKDALEKLIVLDQELADRSRQILKYSKLFGIDLSVIETMRVTRKLIKKRLNVYVNELKTCGVKINEKCRTPDQLRVKLEQERPGLWNMIEDGVKNLNLSSVL